jgi:hypothetical protein
MLCIFDLNGNGSLVVLELDEVGVYCGESDTARDKVAEFGVMDGLICGETMRRLERMATITQLAEITVRADYMYN